VIIENADTRFCGCCHSEYRLGDNELIEGDIKEECPNGGTHRGSNSQMEIIFLWVIA
jgi:hypothetical protein